MKYEMTSLFGSSSDAAVDLAEHEFTEIRDAKAAFLRLTGLEEKIDALLENYLQYERTLLDLTLQRMLLRGLDYPNLIGDMCAINLRVLNLLAACRLYIDQLPRDISRLYGEESSELDSIRSKCRAIYDSSFAYRFSEALRNHVQHHSLPVTRLYYPSSVVDPDGNRRIQYGISPSIDVVQLREDGKIKATLLQELEVRGPHILLTPVLREYVSGIGTLHEHMRNVTKADAERRQACLESALNRVRAEPGRDVGLVVVRVSDDGSHRESHQVFDELIKVRSLLFHKNEALGSHSKRFVSGDIIEPTP